MEGKVNLALFNGREEASNNAGEEVELQWHSASHIPC